MLSAGAMGGGGGASGAEGNSSTTLDGKRKSEMTAEERASYFRERNRVHARNTRARKKQYMEELKERVVKMHAQRAAIERQKEDEARQEEEQVAGWEKTLCKVMELRCHCVTDRARWKELLAENFRFTLSLTPYRSCDPADIIGHRRVLLGIEGMISDVKSLKEMCFNIAKKCRAKAGVSSEMEGSSGASDVDEPRVHLESFLGTGDFLFAGTEGVTCMFSTRTVDAMKFGSSLEIEASGMLRASFADDGRMEAMDAVFDGIAVHQQMQRATGSDCHGAATAALESAMQAKDGTKQRSPPPTQNTKGTENMTPPPPSSAGGSLRSAPAPIAHCSGDGDAEVVEGRSHGVAGKKGGATAGE